MIRFVQSTPIGGDCTCGYKLELDKEYTVNEFIQNIFNRRPNEWGYIGIKDTKSIFGDPNCQYRSAKVITTQLSDIILDSIIESVSASGGWSRMDYLIKLKEDNKI